MKYVLAKEVPHCEIGAEVRFDSETSTFQAYSKYWAQWTSFSSAYGWDKLEAEGWVKQVKPREFWIKIFTVGDRPINVCEDKSPLIYGLEDGYDVIKVREVLE